MKKLLLLLLLPIFVFAQKTATVKGKITNKFNTPVTGVTVTYLNKGTITDINGFYEFKIPLKKTVLVTYSHVNYKTVSKKFTARGVKTFNHAISLTTKTRTLEEVIVKNKKKPAEGVTKINTQKVKNVVGPNAGVESVLMTLPGVSNNNELSTQYNVRGGNFDENLVYVNGIEIYRPFLIRSGQQEGLSFINSHMIKNIDFSAGGFQAKYGDKLSSVLDITYRKPKEFGLQINASLLGASATIENSLLKDKLSAIVGFRYRNNSLFVNAKQTDVNFKPNYTDVQSYLSYAVHKKLSINFLGNFSLNNYNYTPITRITRFGTLTNPLELIVNYEGQETDQFLTLFGALSAEYNINKNLSITAITSTFNTQEEEYFDISASYSLDEVASSLNTETFGETAFSEVIGSQLNHARNDFDALISNIQVKAKLKDGNNEWQIGLKYQQENIKDRIREWEMIDSLGFSVRPPTNASTNQEPYIPNTTAIEAYQNINADNEVNSNRITSFLQFSKKTEWKTHQVWFNAGIRSHTWIVNANNLNTQIHTLVSPRGQLALKPDWKKDMLFRLSGGLYTQPPFYKELRDYNGVIHPEVKAQKSFHAVLGNDYSFSLWNRPFKLTTEAYYKNLYDVNAYAVDNVRIRYRADNVTEAYAYGLDLRLNGEFIPGSDSWVSLGFLKTEENIANQGWISRPTDQRFKVGILFQDYVPQLPDLKVYLNLVYNSGPPGGAPAYADVYEYQNRLNAYRRADIGVSYVFVDANKTKNSDFLSSFKELNLGVELFNVFDISNSITNTWVRDVNSKNQYAIPNYMIGRVLNIKLNMKF